jgi:alcohol dehydrogenase class IV
MDLAKAACAMATNREGASVKDYLEGVGRGLQLREEPLPLLAIPTTAGTGSEATKNAVVSSYAPAFKKSLRSDRMVPRVALVDPELTVSVPSTTTAYTGMDAITQLIESYISSKARPLPRALALQGLELAAPAIERAVRDGGDRDARERMAHAALLSGLALANSGLGLAHGVAAALGVHCRVAHGLACAVMLPVALRVNRETRLREMARLGEAACARTFPSAGAAAAALIDRVDELCAAVAIPRRLRDIGVRREDIPALVTSSRGASMSGNPRQLPDEELARLLEETW